MSSPPFTLDSSGLGLDITADSAEEAARIAMLHWATGARTAVLVCAPVPEEFEMTVQEVDRALDEALRECARAEIRGKAVTPFLLSQMERATGGKTLDANRALLVNNAAIAAQNRSKPRGYGVDNLDGLEFVCARLNPILTSTLTFSVSIAKL